MNILKLIIVLTIAFTSQAWSAGQPKLSDFIMSSAPEMKPIPEMGGLGTGINRVWNLRIMTNFYWKISDFFGIGFKV